MSNDLVLLDARFETDRESYSDVITTGAAFEIFAADLVLRDYKLSYDEIMDGILGGTMDGGLDGFYIFVNGTLVCDEDDLPNVKEHISIKLVIFQMKHASKNEQGVINTLYQHIDYVLNLAPEQADLDTLFNSDVQQKLHLFRSVIKNYGNKPHKLHVEINYCNRATSKPNIAATTLASKIEDKCTDSFSSATASFQFYGAARLYALSIKPIAKTKTLSYIPNGLISSPSSCYVALIKLSEFLGFIVDGELLDQNMFEFNVRDFAGEAKPVNKEISETIQNYQSNTDFWWFNNGVTVVADKADQQSGEIVIENPMIVNGLQTANVIYSNNELIESATNDERSILVRIITVADNDVREGVIKATNSQTKLNSLALKATDMHQRKIEEFLKNKGIYYERRTNYYKNRGKKASKIIDISRLGQAIMAIYLQVPDQSRARPGTFLGIEDNYNKVFPKGADLKRYLVASSMERKLNDFFQKNRKNIKTIHRNNLRFHTMMVLAWTMLGSSRGNADGIDPNILTDAHLLKTFEWVCNEFDNTGLDVKDTKEKNAIAQGEAFTTQLKSNWKLSFTNV